MNLKSLLMSSDEKTVRVLRRVLSDMEIDVEHCTSGGAAIRRITRQRFEAVIVDVANPEEAGSVLQGAKAAPVNKRALTIVLVEFPLGLKGGFEMGAHSVIHKPLAVERAKASFRAVRGANSGRVFRLSPVQSQDPGPLRRRDGDPVFRACRERKLAALLARITRHRQGSRNRWRDGLGR